MSWERVVVDLGRDVADDELGGGEWR